MNKGISFGATAGDGTDVAPTHFAVPGIVLLRRVGTAIASDGTTGQWSRIHLGRQN